MELYFVLGISKHICEPSTSLLISKIQAEYLSLLRCIHMLLNNGSSFDPGDQGEVN